MATASSTKLRPLGDRVVIKPTPPGSTGNSLNFNQGKMVAHNIPLKDVIKFAYDLKSDSQLLNAPDWVKTDWNTLTPLLKSLVIPPPPAYPNNATVDTWLDTHLTSLTTLPKVHTSRKRPTPRSKPWWSRN